MCVQSANGVLSERLHDVDGVEIWAELIGYRSAKVFSQDYKRVFNVLPMQALGA